MKTDKRFLKALDYVLAFEGGKVDDEQDRGGKTNFGITQITFSKWLAENDLEDKSVFEILGEEVEAIYSIYWNESHAALIADDKVATYLFDIAVNSGCRRSGLTLQKALKALGISITPDGMVGSVTLNLVASEAVNKTTLLTAMVAERVKFIDKIIANDNSQKKFENGWKKRAMFILEK
jgi:lysozyme family protein